MMKTKLTIAALVIAGMAAAPFAAQAKSHHAKHHASAAMKSQSTTGANMKPSGMGSPGDTSSEGNVGPGTSNNQGPAPGGR